MIALCVVGLLLLTGIGAMADHIFIAGYVNNPINPALNGEFMNLIQAVSQQSLHPGLNLLLTEWPWTAAGTFMRKATTGS